MALSTETSDTGTVDVVYNLVSILYHALQGAETYEMYMDDAKQVGDDELVKFFRAAKTAESKRAEQARELLKARLK